MNISVTNIIFINRHGRYDKIQFNTQDEYELAKLWWDFCNEEGLIDVIKGTEDYKTEEIK